MSMVTIKKIERLEWMPAEWRLTTVHDNIIIVKYTGGVLTCKTEKTTIFDKDVFKEHPLSYLSMSTNKMLELTRFKMDNDLMLVKYIREEKEKEKNKNNEPNSQASTITHCMS